MHPITELKPGLFVVPCELGCFVTRKASVDFILYLSVGIITVDMICNMSWQCVFVFVQARTYGLDDGDVYMSSYENRFRLFSSLEYEGRLYMTPLNFIESITLNEPKSEFTLFYPSVPSCL